MFGFGQQTYVPDDNFEQHLIDIGCDSVLDNYVQTSSIDTVKYLYMYGMNISDLTGIEDFNLLEYLRIPGNPILSLDISNNTNLFYLSCHSNQLQCLNIANGNYLNFSDWDINDNPNLSCIEVNDSIYMTNNWQSHINTIDNQQYFSNYCNNFCSLTSIQEHSANKELLKITDLLGRETKSTKNEVLFFIYDDGTVEKRIVIE
jgi:hypothetical protein